MPNIEELAIAIYKRTLSLWLRNVDDTFTALHKDKIDNFHEHLNGQNSDIQLRGSWRGKMGAGICLF